MPVHNNLEAYRNKLSLAGGGTGLQNVVVGIAGRKGSGKSSLTREILDGAPFLFLFDTMGEHHWCAETFYDLAEADVFLYEHTVSREPFQARYIPAGAAKDQLETDFSQIATAAYDTGNLTFAVEELPMLSQPQYVPPAFDRIIRLGRHRCINILYTGQRLSECPRRVTAATDVFVLFSHTEPRDLEAIAERCGPECADLAYRLGEHEFLVYDVGRRSLLRVDERWYSALLSSECDWTPAVGKNRPPLWSLKDAE